MGNNAILLIHTNGKDYTYDLEDPNSFYEMQKTEWYKIPTFCVDPKYSDGFIDRYVLGKSALEPSEKSTFVLNWMNMPDKMGNEHFNYLNILITDIENTSIKVRLYGKEYTPDFCKTELYNSLCTAHKSVTDHIHNLLLRIHTLEVYEPVELDNYNKKIFSQLHQYYEKQSYNTGKTYSVNLIISLK